METDEGPFIVECIHEIKDNMDRPAWIRRIMGPFPTFLEAHDWMETVGVKDFETLLIHKLTHRNKYTE